MKQSQDSDKNILYKILKVLKLEALTIHGRVNLAFVVLVTFFCIIYSAGDAISHLISSLADTVKTVALKEDIYHPYESSSLLYVLIPILAIIVLCMLYIYLQERLKITTKDTDNTN